MICTSNLIFLLKLRWWLGFWVVPLCQVAKWARIANYQGIWLNRWPKRDQNPSKESRQKRQDQHKTKMAYSESTISWRYKEPDKRQCKKREADPFWVGECRAALLLEYQNSAGRGRSFYLAESATLLRRGTANNHTLDSHLSSKLQKVYSLTVANIWKLIIIIYVYIKKWKKRKKYGEEKKNKDKKM